MRGYHLLFLFLLTSALIPLHSQTVRINEFMAVNSTTLADKDGGFSDWIELYNPTSSSVNLRGWSLTDDVASPRKWIFPDVNLKAQSYLLLFASNKDVIDPEELHTNFKLDGDGEYLAFFDKAGTVQSEFAPGFPEQDDDVSYAWLDGDFIASTSPTPGSENRFGSQTTLNPPTFSHQRGFYETPFTVELSSPLHNADIYFTLDGSEPSRQTGTRYNNPVPLETTTVLRAIVATENLTSASVTHTYLFLNDVITQSNNPPGYPAEWGPYTAISGTAIADYEMDPDITGDPRYSPYLEKAFLSIPTISLVTKKGNLFSTSTNPDTGGIYIYTGPPESGDVPGLGDDWERPASIEFFTPDGSEKFQLNCGVRIQGGHSRRPEKSPKHSFRLVFKNEYGPKRLKYPLFGEDAASSFNTITLRAGFGNTWIHWRHAERRRGQYVRDVWAKDTQRAMGHPAGHGRYVHLYVNGLYWGLYNPTERLDREFAESYLGGDESEYDVIKDYTSVVDGNIRAWNRMMVLANRDLARTDNYQRIQGNNPDGSPNPHYQPYVDVVSLIDYMLLNFYGGNTDWDHHNWVAIRNRLSPGKGFQFFSWDAEHVLKSVHENVTNENNKNCPSELFQRLAKNADFRRLVADRAQKHCFNGDALTPEAVKARWMKRAAQIELAVIAESARWGDYRRDVHPFQPQGPFDLYDKQYWLDEQAYLVDDYFPNRTKTLLHQLRAAGMFPDVQAPAFQLNNQPLEGTVIEAGDSLSMFATGPIYYTTDGSDPRLSSVSATHSDFDDNDEKRASEQSSTGSVSANAILYTEPIKLTQSTHIKARTVLGGEWSALNEVMLVLPFDQYNLRFTEIHYHPLVEDTIQNQNYEFIEIKNVGTAPIDMSGFEFSQGISYAFPGNTILNPENFIVLASNPEYFIQRYGFAPFDRYEKSLANNGEEVAVTSASHDTLLYVEYDDNHPWPELADGAGFSLVPLKFNPDADQNNSNLWRPSFAIHGSPGRDDTPETGVEERAANVPEQIQLENYPNPFNPVTTISYTIPKRAFVSLIIYDILGRKVVTLIDKIQEANRYNVRFDASRLPSGVYISHLRVGHDFRKKRKMLLIH